MASSSIHLLYNFLTNRQAAQSHTHTLKSLFYFMPTALALTTSLLILLYVSSTSNLFFVRPEHLQLSQRLKGYSVSREKPSKDLRFNTPETVDFGKIPDSFERVGVVEEVEDRDTSEAGYQMYANDTELFHDRVIFYDNYQQMNKTLKIYVYPHNQDDPFANVLLPVDFEPSGNYASESYFKQVLMNSHFITKDPSSANLFFLPFSIARLRHDPRIGTNGIKDFVAAYIFNISHKYPFWNNTGGADHFYVACHSIGRSAMDKALEVKLNAIQIVCSSSYYASSYVAHKDASLPQIWPRRDDPLILGRERTKLAFFAGAVNSPVRENLLKVWENDPDLSLYSGHLTTPYSEALLQSKFCLHVKGFEVNTARIGDALYYGCVPVIIANHYDLPFQDILNWKSFSINIATLDIPLLKKVLQGVRDDEYLHLRENVLKARNHFQWHLPPVDYDAFYMVMYELWIRRSSLRLEDGSLLD